MPSRRHFLSSLNPFSGLDKTETELTPEMAGFALDRRTLLEGSLATAFAGLSGCTLPSISKEKTSGGDEKSEAIPSASPSANTEFFELLPDYPVSKKMAVIINGDARESRHKMNAMRAVAVLKDRFGIDDFYLAADHDISPQILIESAKSATPADSGFSNSGKAISNLLKGLTGENYLNLHQYSATSQDVDRLIADLPLEKDALVFFYITGHGSQKYGDGCFALRDDCYPLSTMVMKLQNLKRVGARGFFVMDQCYSGSFPDAIMESGIEGVAMSPGAVGKETSCQFFTPELFEKMAMRFDANGDGKSEPNEWFQAAMAGYQIQKGTHLDGHFARTKPELSMANFDSITTTKKTLIINIQSKACGSSCYEHTEMLNQMTGIVGEQISVVNLTADKNPEAQVLLKRLGFEKINTYPTTLIRKPDGTYQFIEGSLSLSRMSKLLNSVGVRRNSKVWTRK